MNADMVRCEGKITSASMPSISCSSMRCLPEKAPWRIVSYVQPYHRLSS